MPRSIRKALSFQWFYTETSCLLIAKMKQKLWHNQTLRKAIYWQKERCLDCYQAKFWRYKKFGE